MTDRQTLIQTIAYRITERGTAATHEAVLNELQGADTSKMLDRVYGETGAQLLDRQWKRLVTDVQRAVRTSRGWAW